MNTTRTLEDIQAEITLHTVAISELEQEQKACEVRLHQQHVRCELYANEVQRLTLLQDHTDEIAATVYENLLIGARQYYQAAQQGREAVRREHGQIMDALREHYLPLEMAKRDLTQVLREQQGQQA